MDTKVINPDKAWADGMNQEEFEISYRRRHGAVDCIPSVDEWLYRPNPQYRGIDPVKPSDLLTDDMQESLKKEKDERVAETQRKEEAGECKCSGCGKVCKSMFGLKAHQRHCVHYKENLNG